MPLTTRSAHRWQSVLVIALIAIGAGCEPGTSKVDTVASDSAAVAALADSVEQLEQQWADAIRLRDSVTLDRLMAPTFVLAGTDTAMPPVPRSVWMGNTLQHLRVDTIRLSSSTVVLTGDTADVSMRFFWTGAFDTLPPFRDSTELTDRWVRGPSGWQVHRRTMKH